MTKYKLSDLARPPFPPARRRASLATALQTGLPGTPTGKANPTESNQIQLNQTDQTKKYLVWLAVDHFIGYQKGIPEGLVNVPEAGHRVFEAAGLRCGRQDFVLWRLFRRLTRPCVRLLADSCYVGRYSPDDG
jgi:hypothetical protein